MKKRNLKKAPMVLLMIFMMGVYLFPLYIALITSFKSRTELSKSVLSFPQSLKIDNYIKAYQIGDFFVSMKNSAIVTFASVVLIVISASLCGYTIARNSGHSKLLRVIDKIFLASLMIPFQVLMIPIYKMTKSLGMQNTFLGVIILYTGTSIAYASFLYVGFVKSIPAEIEAAARIDGCNRFQSFCYVVFPLLKPITATVATLHLMWLWNDFNISLIMLQKESVRTITIKQFYFFGEYTADFPVAFAAAVMSMAPIIIFFTVMQKYLVSGLTSGAVKN